MEDSQRLPRELDFADPSEEEREEAEAYGRRAHFEPGTLGYSWLQEQRSRSMELIRKPEHETRGTDGRFESG